MPLWHWQRFKVAEMRQSKVRVAGSAQRSCLTQGTGGLWHLRERLVEVEQCLRWLFLCQRETTSHVEPVDTKRNMIAPQSRMPYMVQHILQARVIEAATRVLLNHCQRFAEPVEGHFATGTVDT